MIESLHTLACFNGDLLFMKKLVPTLCLFCCFITTGHQG